MRRDIWLRTCQRRCRLHFDDGLQWEPFITTLEGNQSFFVNVIVFIQQRQVIFGHRANGFLIGVEIIEIHAE